MVGDAVPARVPYDRGAAARILFGLAGGEDFWPQMPEQPARRTIEYREEILRPARGSHLTARQLTYVLRSLQPCPPYLVTSARARITWRDSEGIVNVAHTGPLGAVVPIVAREATLTLWKLLAASTTLAERTARLDRQEAQILAATTTDKTPLDIFRTGVDAAARTLVQHAYLAAQTPYATPAAFARALHAGRIFHAVATTWHWGLQATTYRRGIVPASFVTFADGLRYSVDTTIALRALKDAQLAHARELAQRAQLANVELETLLDSHGTTPSSAAQYAHLREGERPRCLGQVTHQADGHRASVLSGLSQAFVETFVRLLDTVQVEHTAPAGAGTSSGGQVFEVPDMTCSHCTQTITRLLAELGVDPPEFDLVTKKVVAVFGSDEVRDRAFDAIRRRGYTVIPVS